MTRHLYNYATESCECGQSMSPARFQEHIYANHRGRPAPPVLRFEHPLCPVCDMAVYWNGRDDIYQCSGCEITWDETGYDATWTHPDAPRCESTTYNAHTRVAHRCILAAGHGDENHGDGKHISWSSDDAVPTLRETNNDD